MDLDTYNKAYKKIKKILGNKYCMKYEEIEYDLKQLMEKQYINEGEYKGEKELAQMYSLRWGTLFYAFNLYDSDKKEILKCKLVYRSLLSSIVGNIMAIINLSENGLAFEVNIIMRNMYELCFLFLALTLDKDVCLKYFETKNNTNEYEVWHENLKIRNISKILYEYERKSKIEISPMVHRLRKLSYHEYSRYVHNSFDKCFENSYSRDNETNQFYWDLWGRSNINVKEDLKSLNLLMWVIDDYFKKIFFDDKIFDKDVFFNKENVEAWIETINMSLLTNELFVENYKKENYA